MNKYQKEAPCGPKLKKPIDIHFQVRQTVITKLEMWIMNPKISRPAQDLLLSVAVNCSTHSQADVDVIVNFIKLRLKNKPNVNLYLVIKV